MLLNIRWGSLRAKIIAWFFVPSTVMLLLLALAAVYAPKGPSYLGLQFVLIFLSLVVPAVIVFSGVKKIVTPIAELTRAAQEVAQGNFGQSITAETGDEIEELANQFNLMAGQLKEAYTYLEQRVEDRTRALATLNAVAQVTSRSLHLQEVLDSALEEVLARLSVEIGMIFLIPAPEDTLNLAAQRGFTTEAFKDLAQMGLQKGILGQPVLDGQPLTMSAAEFVESGQAPAAVLSLIEREHIQALVSAPILYKSQTMGSLTLATRQKRAFLPQELDLLLAIGQHLGMALENARLYEQAQKEIEERKRIEDELRQTNAEGERRNRELTMLNRVMTITTSSSEPKDILNVICRELVQALDVNQAAAALVQPDGDTLKVVAECKSETGPSALDVLIPINENPATLMVIKTRTPLALSDAQHDILTTPIHALMKERGVVSLLILPLVVRNEVIGTIGLDAWQKREFSKTELEMAMRVSATAAQALENMWEARVTIS